MFYVHNISEIKKLWTNDDGTMGGHFVVDYKDCENNEELKVLMVFPRFIQDKNGALSLLPSSDNKLYSIEIDPLMNI